MSNATARSVIRQAVLQTGYTEGRNNSTKFGAAIGANYQSWCASFLWWCGDRAKGENPIAKSASAAYIQDNTVSQRDGSWVMRKTGSNVTKKKGLEKSKFGDVVSFDFGAGDLWRDHTGFVLGRSGSSYVTIEGNTSAGATGSQNNGDCVAIRIRHYSNVCSIVRPDYAPSKVKKPSTPFVGLRPVLPKDGSFKCGEHGEHVKRLQSALKWATKVRISVDGAFWNETLWAVVWFQHCNGLVPDGEFGPESMKALNKLIREHKVDEGPKLLEVETPAEDAPAVRAVTVKKTPNQLLVERAIQDAWPKGTKRRAYRYPSGKRRAQYTKDLQTAYGSRSGWGYQTRAGASCDVFVGTVVRAAGVDKSFPRGLDEQIPYLEKSKKWKQISRKNIKPGDIIVQKYKTGGKHIMIYLGNGKVANAHYVKKTFPIIESSRKIVKSPSRCSMYRVYRRA